ncbi:hypothetical protein BOC40_06540 [Burkholderia pseudomallei]|uniref:hypothetical protein n=1 Tax=Burkholderia pseudomallei TaxID=28450 RepID=UPI000A1A07EF|nr:hypothetical protein [Burkholderia pseudomallei]ARK80119.1 hypothetical protein BOC40_06540 [Burkholderia pseudomallei]ARL46295.1 hypothetical protein BOC50_25365 [Burkholderia pseudomallei]
MLPAFAFCKNAEPAAILDMLAALVEMWGELPDNIVYLLSQLFSAQADLPFRCTDIALAETGVDIRVASALAMATATSRGLAAVEYFLSFAETSEAKLASVGLAGLCAIDAEIWSNARAYRDRVIEVAVNALQHDHAGHLGYRLLNHLSVADSQAQTLVAEAVIAGNHNAQLETARWVRFMARQLPSDHVAKLIEALVRGAVQDSHLRAEVDGTIASLTYNAQTSPLGLMGIDCIGRFFTERVLDESFSQSYNLIVADNDRFSQTVSRWLLMADISLPALRSLLAHSQTFPNKLVADVSAFSATGELERVRAVRRLIGLCYNGAAIANFLYSLASNATTAHWALHAFEDVANNFLRIEYPAETRNFFAARRSSAPARSKLRRVIVEALKLMKQWDEVLRALPRLKELRPRQEKMLTLRLATQKRNRGINKEARRKSVFASLATPVHIKQGRAVIARMWDGTSTITPLTSHSVEFEVPNSEVADPLLGHLLRHRYLSD